MRNNIILSLDIDDPVKAKIVIEELGPLFGGILIPSWRLYSSLLDLIPETGSTIWLNMGAGFPSQVQEDIRNTLRFFFPESYGPERKFIPLKGIITLCYPHLLELIISAFKQGVKEYTNGHLRHSIPSDWQIPIYPTAALTTEEMDNRILARAEIAKKYYLPGVIVPFDWVEKVKTLGLDAIVTGIRDPNYPVDKDDQIIICLPDEAANSGAAHFIIGRPILQHLERDPKVVEYFLKKLGVG